MERNNSKEWRFGPFVIDTGRRELRRDGRQIEVQPRVFDLLVYLAANHDRAVGKDELQDAVWPGRFITETALTRAVMKARKALDDDANRQQVIKTVHGHGYRFVAELLPAETSAETSPDSFSDEIAPSPAGPEKTDAQPPSPDAAVAAQHEPTRFLMPTVFVLLSIVTALLAWAFLRPELAVDPETRVAVLPLADETGDPELAWTRLGLMSYVGNLLEADGDLAVVGDGSVVGLAENLGWNGKLEDPANAELLEKLQTVYGASHLLAMQLQSEGPTLRMNFRLLGPDGRLRQGTMVGDEGTRLAQGVVQSVYGSILGKRRSDQDLPLVSADPFNNEAFARGMDLSLQGRCAEAVAFFRIIMEQEPELFAPRYEYAACKRILGEAAEAETLLDELVAEQRQQGPSRPLAQALMLRGVLYNRTGRLDQAEVAHREALKVAESIDEHELAAGILQNLSIVHEDRAQLQEADELLDLAVLAYQAAGRETMPGQLYAGKANLRLDRGELVEAVAYLEQALQAFRNIGDRRNEAMMLNNMGLALREMGRVAEAESFHLRSLEIREEIGDRVGTGRVYGQLSAVYSAQGRYQEALRSARSAARIAAETQDRLFEGTSLAQWGSAAAGLGDHAEARKRYLESRAVFSEIQDRLRVLQADILLARLDLRAGQRGAAESAALEVLEQARRNHLMQPEIEAMELLGEIAMAEGDVRAAIGEYEAALARVRESTWASKETEIAIRLLNAYLDVGDIQAAAPLAGMLGAREPNVGSLKARARFAWAREEADRALALMEEARELAGANWDEESEQLLAAYRQR